MYNLYLINNHTQKTITKFVIIYKFIVSNKLVNPTKCNIMKFEINPRSLFLNFFVCDMFRLPS